VSTRIHDSVEWSRVRGLWPLDPGVAHLNHGSYGAVPHPVQQEQDRWRARVDANPVRFFRREWQPAVEQARRSAAAFLGADPDGLALVPNATAGAGAVLASFPLAPGDEVLVTDHGYGAVTGAVRRACARAGGSVCTAAIPLTATDEQICAAVLDEVHPRTRLAVLDHVTSPTARLLPVERLVPALQAQGVAVLVDAAHSPGLLPVDLDALQPDFWTGNFHKWLCAPRGAAALWASRRHRAALPAPVVSWREEEGYPYSFSMPGTADSSAILALPAALALLAELGGLEQVTAHNNALAGYARSVLAQALGLDGAEVPREPRLPMAALPLPEGLSDADRVQQLIADRAGAETAVSDWNGRLLLRVSAHAYNRPEEYERLALALPGLLSRTG
jgi:isopenicillin-N epimerase